MAQSSKKASYRMRVYQDQNDPTVIMLVFGNDPAPDNAKLLSDHDVTEVTTVVDHVEPSTP